MEQTFDFEIELLNLDNSSYLATVNYLKELIKENATYKNLLGKTDYSSEPEYFKHVLLFSLLLKPFFKFDIAFDLENPTHAKLLDIIKSNPKNSLKNAFNHVISIFNEKVDLSELNECISEIVQEISDISAIFNRIHGNTISLQEIISLADASPELNSLLDFEIPDGLQFSEIEDLVASKVDEAIRIISSNNTNLANFINCGSAVNLKQLGQTIVNVGLKPDLFGKVLSEPINTSFLKGLRNVTDFYVNAIGARKAIITNYRQVRKSGYLARKIALLLLPHNLDKTIEDCGTHFYVNKTIPDSKTYEYLLGRFLSDGTELTIEKANDFIGKTVELRSPITCASENGVCSKCYGKLFKVNKDLHAGLIAMLLLTEELTQRLLSSKHLLQTNTDRIEMSEDFDNCFIVDKSLIISNGTADRISINPDDVEQDEILGLRYITKFNVTYKNSTKLINSPINLYLTEEIEELVISSFNASEIKIELDVPDQVVFQMVVDNNELSASLFEIINLIEKGDHLGYTDIDSMANRFSDLIQESGLKTVNVHNEMIIRALVRKDESSVERPSFKSPEMPSYFIQTVSNGILNSSLGISLVFEKIKKQLTDVATFEKNEVSILDKLFLKFVDREDSTDEGIHQ